MGYSLEWDADPPTLASSRPRSITGTPRTCSTLRLPTVSRTIVPRPVVLLVGRDRRELDLRVSMLLAAHFRGRGWSVAWDDPSWSMMDLVARVFPGIERRSASTRQNLRKWLRRLWCLVHWRDLALLLGAPKGSRNEREDFLRRRVAGLARTNPLLLVGRSAGALVSTRLAEEFGAVGVVALGYPFRAPGMAEDASRTSHLRAMRVPTLILQGIDDPYGGSDAESRYGFSKMVSLRLLETDHDFAVDGKCWSTAFGELDRFLDALEPTSSPSRGFPVGSMHLSRSQPMVDAQPAA